MFDHCLYFNTSALARKLERVWADAFAPFDLTPPQGFMLRAIVDRPGMLQSELSEAMSVTRPTATRALDGLEAKGLIERRKTEADGRETAIFPTPEAMKIGAALNDASGAVTARLKRVLGSAEFTDTVSKIRGVRSTLT
ncbi:MarR family transcriptional regulator [Ralstonia insidiosa]|jgi:DNA-binding MarR family transcriptional regulator|uniref:MarR family transcriptional regulator n=1 Tax=Ralstonia insidiosa TaxID=190721 RepID=A0A192A5Y3_9RALS|nr:MarR family transcriptional regulator [Ralstonia insidiosa]ANJ75702.1 MarR family transcriptional regulator [Ralstonia insidiosa]KAB0469502.1 MarR family transcriptional regulator [Ralstonia insidiosa]MBY4910189.1 MarR family transcriptional regulator [Ralstonia insidiosa]NMV37987.1 MarR family transcriptional regulator [Ralstonia insidiosa]